MPEPAAAVPEHRVELVQLVGALAHELGVDAGSPWRAPRARSALVRQELVQRRIEQADRDRQAGHDLEDARRSPARCIGSSLASAARRPAASLGEDHLAHRRRCGRRRRTCARCGRGRCPRRRTGARCARRAGVSALVRTLSRRTLVGPAHQLAEVAARARARRSARRRARPRRCAPSSVITSPAHATSRPADASGAARR